jgi:hypothetical protein
MTAINATAYVDKGASQGLADYHAAQAVKAALRRRTPIERLSGVREALRHYRVSSWLVDDKIELRLDAKAIAIL